MKNESKSNSNQNRNTQKPGREIQSPHLLGKPIFEEAKVEWPPELMFLQNANYDLQVTIDSAHYDHIYQVQKEHTYTLRLGIHSSKESAGAFDEYTTVACFIPIMHATEQRITCFFMSEDYQECFMDTIWLRAKRPFKIIHVFGSAALESNGNSLEMPLDFDATNDMDGQMVIFRRGGIEDIPSYSVFRFDLLRIRVEIV